MNTSNSNNNSNDRKHTSSAGYTNRPAQPAASSDAAAIPTAPAPSAASLADRATIDPASFARNHGRAELVDPERATARRTRGQQYL